MPLQSLRCYDAIMSPKGKPLTDEQYAAIAWADPSESSAALSRRLGVEYETVRLFRQRMARAGGWECELVVLTCPECDKPLMAAAYQSGATRRRRHPDCQRTHLARHKRDRARRVARERGHQRTLAVMRETYQRNPPQTGAYAFRDHVPWTPEEDARLLETMQLPAQEMAKELGRSLASIYTRRSVATAIILNTAGRK
jgi:hypothetical protein